jgi:hypothetical protein
MCVCMYIRIMYAFKYVCMLYSSISARLPFTQLPCTPLLVVSIICHLRFHESELRVVLSPVTWGRYQKIHR